MIVHIAMAKSENRQALGARLPHRGGVARLLERLVRARGAADIDVHREEAQDVFEERLVRENLLHGVDAGPGRGIDREGYRLLRVLRRLLRAAPRVRAGLGRHRS